MQHEWLQGSDPAASLLSFWHLSTPVWAVEETVIDVLALGLARPPDIWRGEAGQNAGAGLSSQELTLLMSPTPLT